MKKKKATTRDERIERVFRVSRYADASNDLTTRQGLNPVVRALRDADVAVEVEQTCGFTMVASVYNHERTQAVKITWDGYWAPCPVHGPMHTPGPYDMLDGCVESIGGPCIAQGLAYLVVFYPHHDREGILWKEGEVITEMAEAEQLSEVVTRLLDL